MLLFTHYKTTRGLLLSAMSLSRCFACQRCLCSIVTCRAPIQWFLSCVELRIIFEVLLGKKTLIMLSLMSMKHEILGQGSETYGSRARCGSFDDGIWLAWYFLNTIFRNETFRNFPPTRLQSHQQHHAASEVPLTVRSMLLKRKFRHLPLFKIVGFAQKCTR